MSKNKNYRDRYPDVEYVHSPHLGISVAIRSIETGGFAMSMSFAHKASHSGRTHFEQFNRKKGRNICEARLENISPTVCPPYCALWDDTVNTRDISNVVKSLLNDIEKKYGSADTAPRGQQADNGHIFSLVIADILKCEHVS